MKGRKSSKAAPKPSLKKSAAGRRFHSFHKGRKPSFTPKTSKPDIKVKKSSYSKAARLSVLASADARQRLIDMGGENTIDIIREFDRDMSDEELARKTGIKASDVRVVLNRLHSQGLFSYTRVRDRDSGWYSYIWKMSEGRLRGFIGSLRVAGQQEEDADLVGGEDYLKKNFNLRMEGEAALATEVGEKRRR